VFGLVVAFANPNPSLRFGMPETPRRAMSSALPKTHEFNDQIQRVAERSGVQIREKPLVGRIRGSRSVRAWMRDPG
jgi:hypothetical protein